MPASPDGLLERELSRRGLLVGGALAIATVAQAVDVLGAAAQVLGAHSTAAAGDAAVRATLEAYADTIVPGPAGGADRAPGAIEAGAVDEIYDPFYGASYSFPFLHDDIQLATPHVLGRAASFDLGLPYPDRARVVADRIAPLDRGSASPLALLYGATAVLIYLAYYGNARSDLGLRYIGLPPHSDGYRPHHSYGICFEGMTADGNPR